MKLTTIQFSEELPFGLPGAQFVKPSIKALVSSHRHAPSTPKSLPPVQNPFIPIARIYIKVLKVLKRDKFFMLNLFD